MTAKFEIRAPRSDLPRYCPGQAFPGYRYVPGVHPHPVRDPAGHSFGHGAPFGEHPGWQPRDWSHLRPWLWGVDLFNHFYFWEAHEAWESLWGEARKDSDPKLFLQGLIQIAAALLKVSLRSSDGAARLSTTGIEKLTLVSERTPMLMGLDVIETTTTMRTYFSPLTNGILPELDEGVPRLLLSRDRLPENAEHE